MPIKVTCTACHTDFKVSEKFAGKKGPCPKCKKVINVPTLEEAELLEQAPEVVVHAPEEFGGGGKDKKGRLLVKPVSREDAQFKMLPAVIIGVLVVIVLGMASFFGQAFKGAPVLKISVSALILVISVPVSLAAYWILRDADLEPYSGKGLYIRTAAAAGIYCLLWIGLWYVAWLYPHIFLQGWNWLFVAPPFLLLGALTAHWSLDMELDSAFFHYSMFLLVSIAIRWVAGMPPL